MRSADQDAVSGNSSAPARRSLAAQANNFLQVSHLFRVGKNFREQKFLALVSLRLSPRKSFT
jgi:hypothetical protein